LAACSSATWFGSNHSLIELDPATGKVTNYSVPSVNPVPEVDATVPQGAKIRSGVQSIACSDKTSEIVLSLSNSESIVVFSTDSHQFRKISIPDHTSTTQVAADESAHAAVGLQVFGQDGVGRPTELELVDLTKDETKTVKVADSSHVAEGTDAFVAGDATDANQVEPASGTVAKRGAAVTVDADPSIGAAQALPDGRYVVASKSGLRLVDPTGKQPEVNISLGQVECFNGGAAPDGSPLPTSPPGASCPVQARAVAVDDLGNVFFVPSAGTPTPVEQIVLPS
jgi:hypothetical protein